MAMVERKRGLTNYELSRPAMTLARRFVQRWDIHAQQLDDGRYICVHKPLNVDHLFGHLRGEITLGAYLLDNESRARYIVIDADNEQGFSELLHLAKGLEQEFTPSYLERSRRGGHLWMFFDQPINGRQAREFGRGLMAAYEIGDLELFPKQNEIGEGPGSLIRMPFGVHRISGRRYGFINSGGESRAPTVREQIHALSEPQTVPKDSFDAYRECAPSEALSSSIGLTENSESVVSERIKSSVTALEFISQYIDLRPITSGGVGRCPFHDDHRPSFGVNDEGNYWHCFSGCGGGSVIDFWMKWRGCDFTTAVTELAGMLL
jgi:hypothetical protein